MSATNSETLSSDEALRVLSEKNAQRKNGYFTENNSKGKVHSISFDYYY